MNPFEDGAVKQRPLVYLAGSIMFPKDHGAGWRTNITPHLSNLGYRLFNPVIDQPIISGVSKEDLIALQNEKVGDYQEACRKIVDTDLNVLCQSSLVVVKIDEGVLKGAGTYGELTVARLHDIPVIAWIDLPRGFLDVPCWAFGCITQYAAQEREFYKIIPSAAQLTSQKQEAQNEEWGDYLSDT